MAGAVGRDSAPVYIYLSRARTGVIGSPAIARLLPRRTLYPTPIRESRSVIKNAGDGRMGRAVHPPEAPLLKTRGSGQTEGPPTAGQEEQHEGEARRVDPRLRPLHPARRPLPKHILSRRDRACGTFTVP
jgi:hypothetical protein